MPRALPAWPQRGRTTTICLADFGTSTFLLVSLRSEQSCAVPIWEKQALQPRSPPLRLGSRPSGSSPPPWPIWLSCCEGRSPVGSQIALHCPGPPRSWKPRNLSRASRWGCLRQEGGASPSVGPAGVVPWVRKALLGSQHTLGVRPGLATQGLACCHWNWGRQLLAWAGGGAGLEVRLGGRGCCPWDRAHSGGVIWTALRTGSLVGLELEGAGPGAGGPFTYHARTPVTPWHVVPCTPEFGL